MPNCTVTIDPKLRTDLKTYASAVCSSLAGQVRDDMYDAAKYAIDRFYADYTPKRYKRHETNFKENSFEKYYSNPHGTIARGGVRLTPGNLNAIYEDPPGTVFDIVYSGVHGNYYVPVMEPSPMDLICQERDLILTFISEYQYKAMKDARKKSYSVIKV